MKQKRAYKYRAYPTTEQASILARTFGCARYVYNWALRLRTDAYYQRHKRVYYADTSSALTQLKQQQSHQWLNEVSSVPPQQALRHLDKAFRNFFAGRAAYPTFKKKHGAQAAEYTASAFNWDGTSLTLAKMTDPLDIRWSRPLPKDAQPTTVTVTLDTAGRYFVSILVAEEIKPLPDVTQEVGLDLGLKSMVILSTGETAGNPKFFAQDEQKLARAQRHLAKKQRVCKSRTWSRTTALPKRSVTLGGVSSCASWSTKPRGIDARLSRLTSSTPPLSGALTVVISSTPFRLMSVPGHALHAACSMTETSMLLETFWRLDKP